MTEWVKGNKIEKRNKNSDKGGTMRLGSYKAKLKKNTKVHSIYKKNIISKDIVTDTRLMKNLYQNLKIMDIFFQECLLMEFCQKF